MAGVGLFARLGNLWRGFLSLWISDIEKQHPEIAYENAINSMVEKYSRLKTATAAIIRRREEMDERFRKTNGELAQTEAELMVAVETGQDDLAVVLIQKKNQLTVDLTELKAELDSGQKDADSAKSSLLSVQSEIRKLKGERDSMLAKMQSAQARLKIQEQRARSHPHDDCRGEPRPRALRVLARRTTGGAAPSDRRRPGPPAARRAQGQARGAAGEPGPEDHVAGLP
jgi:phage shock protein A